MIIRAKKFNKKIQQGYKKITEFHADFKSVEKVVKKCTTKVICKNVLEICNFFTFTPIFQLCFP